MENYLISRAGQFVPFLKPPMLATESSASWQLLSKNTEMRRRMQKAPKVT
jgi:hypothetical protein